MLYVEFIYYHLLIVYKLMTKKELIDLRSRTLMEKFQKAEEISLKVNDNFCELST